MLTYRPIFTITEKKLPIVTLTLKEINLNVGDAISRNVSSYINDNEILIRFTYKNRNYILHINNDYGLVTIEQIESANIGSVGYDEIALLNDIREILPYTEFEGYNVYAISYFNSLGYVGNKPVTIKKMEISIDTGNEDIAVYRAIIKPTKEVEGKFVDYFGGLSKFNVQVEHDRLKREYARKQNIRLIVIDCSKNISMRRYFDKLDSIFNSVLS